jgi:hypothetical protein
LALALLRCDIKTEKSAYKQTLPKTADEKIKLHKIDKLFLIGDFDGDRKQDTIFQHIFSRLLKTEIENSPDPLQNDWNKIVKWFNDQDANLFLTFNTKNQDTLHLGAAQGLYCLLNIGDNNADGKDEIALVIDYLDFSQVNSCKIYSLCNKKWTILKQFGIHESSFDFAANKSPIFNDIKNFLEKRNGKWVYKDYSQESYETKETVKKMTELKVAKCK